MGGLRKVCKLLISRLARILANDRLSRKLEEALPESIARQFQKAEDSSLAVLAIENRIERVDILSSEPIII